MELCWYASVAVILLAGYINDILKERRERNEHEQAEAERVKKELAKRSYNELTDEEQRALTEEQRRAMGIVWPYEDD